MKTKEIKTLIELLESADLEEISYKEADFEISLKRRGSTSAVREIVPERVVAAETAAQEKTFKSPLVGVFYTKPSPDSKPYVSVGSRVQAGETLCIVEAMKVMNEIKAQEAGIIKAILVEDGTPIAYHQDLFVLE